ncbi:unnamed protein product [Ceutorhynchus assimilis]|uniref:CAAX prenyl protease 2 n=1 Tax=Ceutorhynchus assimilis TaxID=467358 RepID=A0A9N9MMW1_9CUCU|nr:unnamed protein product [Ceutorhynchus assimilis]
MDLDFFKAILDCLISVGICFLLSVTYLASLHIWNSPYNRDHPSTIKKRFTSVFFMLFIAPCFLYAGLNKSILEEASLLEILGLRTKGLLQAIFMPLFLTMILFLGPISMELYSGLYKLYTEESYWYRNLTNLIWIRNHIVAPFSEEFTYRSCMLPLLLQCLPPVTAVLVNPLFFGVAHFHHMQERLKFGMDVKTALKISCFQFTYTTIFGTYSAYIFYRTGHFLSIFIMHAFCNHMGFPDIMEVTTYKKSKKIIISGLFVLGFIAWCFLLKPLTEPAWYYHSPTWYNV